ncbi:MAG: hypothetical protein L0H31_16210, partial [Nocardioidaceae bacterium]|nr:hypothetical protein [Nocardioidaceae bacterium]
GRVLSGPGRAHLGTWSASDLDRVDSSVRIDMDKLRGMGPAADGNNTALTVNMPRLIKPKDVSAVLVEPERGDKELNHNNAFDWVADTWDNGLSVLKQGVEFLRKLGFEVPDVPVKSLRDYVVYPLSGDWGAIRGNANACGICKKGMSTWGNNFSTLSVEVTSVMLGQTSLRMVGHLNLYNIAVTSMGAGVKAGGIVFEEIADLSERIGREVEDALVWLGKKVAKLLTKIGLRCIPYVGWTILGIELLLKGLDTFKDIWEDAVDCIDMVNDLLDLVDEVKAWAQTQADRLDAFEQILDAAEDLPVVKAHQGIEDLLANVTKVEKTLREITEFASGENDEKGDVDGTLDDMRDTTYDPPEDKGFHKEPTPLDPDKRNEPLPGPGERLTY